MIHFEYAAKNENDARLILQWRNNPQTLGMSFHKAAKTWESFYKEFAKSYFAFPDLPPLFATVEGKRVAFLRFRPLPNHSCDISINVAPEFREKGLGTKILKEIQDFVHTQGYQTLIAEIRVENKVSCKAFEAAGFKLLEETKKEIFDTGEIVPIYRYSVSLAPKPIQKPVFIIAEIGSNWRVGSPREDLARAKVLIEAAAVAGADAAKFQTYRPETIYVPNAGKSSYLAERGIDAEMSTLFAELAMPYEMIPQLADLCRSCNIQFLSTPFSPADFAAVDPHVLMHKIASYEIGHIQLLQLAAKSKKPLLLSTGAATEEEIDWAVHTYFERGGRELTLLQCTACYPADPKSLNLIAIPWLKQRFHLSIGLSDHSRHPLYAPVAAVALGATVIEKHFTLDNALPGPDHAFAILPQELKEMVKAIRETELMRGEAVKDIDPSEIELRSFAKRGIQAIKPIAKGDLFQDGINIAILRPGQQPLGIHPKELSEIEGKKAARAIPLGHGLKRGDWE
jgi:sialic acid synthase SpsE/RimJ/RimL family protein N-acetyltransferase